MKPRDFQVSDPPNRFYERLGFKVVESARLGAGGPEAWAMLRETPNP